jgi:hypothetical protein
MRYLEKVSCRRPSQNTGQVSKMRDKIAREVIKSEQCPSSHLQLLKPCIQLTQCRRSGPSPRRCHHYTSATPSPTVNREGLISLPSTTLCKTAFAGVSLYKDDSAIFTTFNLNVSGREGKPRLAWWLVIQSHITFRRVKPRPVVFFSIEAQRTEY